MRHLTDWLPGYFFDQWDVALQARPVRRRRPARRGLAVDGTIQDALDDPAVADSRRETRMGPSTFAEQVDMICTPDVLIPTWDLARAAGLDEVLDPGECARNVAGVEAMDPTVEQGMRDSGHYGPRRGAYGRRRADPPARLHGPPAVNRSVASTAGDDTGRVCRCSSSPVDTDRHLPPGRPCSRGAYLYRDPARKSTVARLLAGPSAVAAWADPPATSEDAPPGDDAQRPGRGDAFFGFLARGAVAPWLPGSHEQNEIVTRAAATTAGRFAAEGYDTVFDGMVGPGSSRRSPRRPGSTASTTWCCSLVRRLRRPGPLPPRPRLPRRGRHPQDARLVRGRDRRPPPRAGRPARRAEVVADLVAAARAAGRLTVGR